MKLLVLNHSESDYDYSYTEIIGTFLVEDDFDLDEHLRLWKSETLTYKVGKNQHGSWKSKSAHYSIGFDVWLSRRYPHIEMIEHEI